MKHLVLLAALIPAVAHADWDGAENQQCQGSTLDNVLCVNRLTDDWDRRLNEAYQMRMAESDRPEELRKAQRLWIAYRDANCGYYRAGPGSISAIEAAECRRAMTRQRATELEQGNH